MGGKTELADRKYIESGVWKCKESPTGAHHWVELVEGKLANRGYFLCIHCHDVTRFPIRWDQVQASFATISTGRDIVDKALDELSNRRLG